MRKTWLQYAKWSIRPKFKPAWSIKTPRKRSPVECNFDHVSHSGLFLGKSLCYWDILWTTLGHYIDGTMVHELDTANNYFCIYEKIRFACFFLAHPVQQSGILSVAILLTSKLSQDGEIWSKMWTWFCRGMIRFGDFGTGAYFGISNCRRLSSLHFGIMSIIFCWVLHATHNQNKRVRVMSAANDKRKCRPNPKTRKIQVDHR